MTFFERLFLCAIDLGQRTACGPAREPTIIINELINASGGTLCPLCLIMHWLDVFRLRHTLIKPMLSGRFVFISKAESGFVAVFIGKCYFRFE
jgi:hypothetical protein